MAGGHGDSHERDLILQLVKDFPNECHFTGWVGGIQMKRLLSQAALLIVPSRYEPFGLTALEALRVGTPVIGSAIGGLRSILTPDSGGIAVEGFDTDTWFEVCRDLLTDEGRMMRLSVQGPRYVASHFNIDGLARQFLKIIGNF
jgi:glycosyltransferase involved in cell wall biosynthesis